MEMKVIDTTDESNIIKIGGTGSKQLVDGTGFIVNLVAGDESLQVISGSEICYLKAGIKSFQVVDGASRWISDKEADKWYYYENGDFVECESVVEIKIRSLLRKYYYDYGKWVRRELHIKMLDVGIGNQTVELHDGYKIVTVGDKEIVSLISSGEYSVQIVGKGVTSYLKTGVGSLQVIGDGMRYTSIIDNDAPWWTYSVEKGFVQCSEKVDKFYKKTMYNVYKAATTAI